MQLMPILSQQIVNGVSVSVFTRPIDSISEKEKQTLNDCAEYLKAYGVSFHFRRDLFQRCVGIDQHICWYGSVNALTYNSPEACAMRLVDREIANSLLDAVQGYTRNSYEV